jgi:hypothetical protein
MILIGVTPFLRIGLETILPIWQENPEKMLCQILIQEVILPRRLPDQEMNPRQNQPLKHQTHQTRIWKLLNRNFQLREARGTGEN